MDNQIPTWEVGQGGEGDTTSQVAYNRSDAQNNLNTYYFGASSLDVANSTLGFNEVADGSGNFKEHLDTRMRNRSAHPIQMYNDEDTIGPNNAHTDWQDAIAASHATIDAKDRAVQTLWMKDLRLSPWFRHMFSKIAKDPAWQGRPTSSFAVGDTTLSLDGGIHLPSIESSGSIEVVHFDGFVDSAAYSSAAISTNKSVTVSETGATFSAGYAELIEMNYGKDQQIPYIGTVGNLLYTRYYVDLWLPVVTTGHPDGGAWSPSAKLYGKNIALSGWTGTGDTAATLNGVYRVVPAYGHFQQDQPWDINNVRTSQSGATLARVRLKKLNGSPFFDNFTSSSGISWSYVSALGYKRINWSATSPQINGTPGGGVLISNANYDPDRWAVYKTVETFTSGSVSYGTDLTLPTTNFLQRDITTNNKIKIRDIDDNDYKHIWILWSDMRNNGEANADNNSRRKSFGLMSPYASNYSLTLDFANSDISNTNERQTFTDLKIGEEVDLWEMDATADPVTGEAWSDIANGSVALQVSTTLNGAVLVGATSITLTDATDFPTAGYGVLYGTASLSGSSRSDYFSWTGKAGNILTGVTGVKLQFTNGSRVQWFNDYAEWDKKGGSFV